MDPVDFITTRLKAEVADPIVAALPTELAAIATAIRLANLRYWTACPYVYETIFTVEANDTGQYLQSIPTLTSMAFTNAPAGTVDLSYYLGILRLSDATFGTSVRSFDAWLLGVPIGSSIAQSWGSVKQGATTNSPNIIDYDRMLLDATNFRAMTGQVEFTIDTTTQTITYLIPSYYGEVTVDHGFGFDDPSLQFIPFNHFDIFCKIAIFEFLSLVIRARTSIELNGDFKINTDELARRRDEVKIELKKDIPQITKVAMLWA